LVFGQVSAAAEASMATFPIHAGERYAHLATFDCTFVADGVMNIAMNRPTKLNAQTQQMWSETGEVFRLAHTDPDVRCVILSGNGRYVQPHKFVQGTIPA
jgi:1,4-dihydroxy-2-naphthoyl-CoA synthase